MTVLDYLTNLHEYYCFWSVEKPCTIASKSELRRWFLQKAFSLNGESDWAFDEDMPIYVWSMILFPNSKTKIVKDRIKYSRRTTLI
jgi:hypothetical protein